jgi:hypothetical protein
VNKETRILNFPLKEKADLFEFDCHGGTEMHGNRRNIFLPEFPACGRRACRRGDPFS